MLGNQQPITEQLTAHIQQLKDIHATLNTISQDIYLNTTETGCLELVGSLRRQLAEAAREILYLGTLQDTIERLQLTVDYWKEGYRQIAAQHPTTAITTHADMLRLILGSDDPKVVTG